MTLDTFFKKFDQFADAPDAVAKMRELVLQLAIQGELVEPSSKPEADRAWLAFKKEISERIYSYDPGPPPPFEIPEHWEWSVLGEVAKPCGQKTPDENFTYIDVGSIDNARGELKPDLNTIEVTNAPSRARKLAQLGSVIYATVRPYLKNIAVIEKEFSPPAIISTAFAILHPLPFVESRFLFYWLRSSAFEREVSAYAKGVAYPAISDGDLKGCVIPVPPPSEQKRIVAKVDELMALCDRLEARQQQRDEQASALARASLARFAQAPTPANLNLLFHKSYSIPPAELRKAILAMAVRGRLVPQDSKDESAARVLERIDAAPKRAMRTRTTDEADGDEPTAFKPLFELPPGWEWAPFRRLPLHASVGLDRGRAMQGPDKSVGYFKMNNIRNSGGVDLADLTRIDATLDEIEAFALADGDFLFNTRNSRELVGKTCVFRSPSSEPILNNNNILRVKFIEGFSPDFLDYWFRSPEGSAELEKLKSNTTNVCAIYQGKLSGFPCVIPPLAEQRRIVGKVDQLMALVDQLETQLATSRSTAKDLLEALVAELTTA